ncbi:heme exporter protein B [Stella humosa]|uniref:Heme exporter protein B n=1 Tax=Stella humosa TaxID=94 RepID=A0A3N1L0E0_9PROT|nr:heme exporter protein CcmB [Stella humosa]ROP84410.1 heme exporter protein B [Stella humosa]BBK33926.1 heme exporter protein B [Stella humosa]
MRAFTAILARDLRLALRQGGDAAAVVLFFVLAASLFPFGVGPEPNLLARIASGVIWVTALLSVMLGLDRLFLADHEDGSLEAMLASPLSAVALVVAKCLAQWLLCGLPLILAAPVLALFLQLPVEGLPILLAALALGTPTLVLMGAIGAALVLGARRGGILLALLVLPLTVPVLIFGVAAVDAAIAGLPARPHLLVLGALLLATLAAAPFAAAAALRQSVE